MKKIVLAVSGASGSIYAKGIMDRLASMRDQWSRVGVVFSENAKYNWELEIGQPFSQADYPFDFYEKRDFNAPFASGSAKYGTMIICPCSMGALGRIRAGVSDDLITRAADVILKERRQLILCPRETPLSSLHLENMLSLSQQGAIICPAVPSFYSNPKNITELVATVTDRILDLAGFELDMYRWNDK